MKSWCEKVLKWSMAMWRAPFGYLEFTSSDFLRNILKQPTPWQPKSGLCAGCGASGGGRGAVQFAEIPS